MLEFVIHAPPYTHHSAGFRAQYKLCAGIQERGYEVAIKHITTRPLGLPGFVPDPDCPYDVPLVNEYTAAEVRDAFHFYPDLFEGNEEGVERFGFWMGRHDQFMKLPENALRFTWIQDWDKTAQRLCIDVVEPFFYPKTQPGKGTLYYAGKGHLPTFMTELDPRIINHTWPATRRELAAVLRGARLLVSADGNTMLNLEATICGTPVHVIGTTPRAGSTLYGSLGIAFDPSALPRAQQEVHRAAGYYHHTVRQEIAHDIDRFIERCLATK